MSRRSTTPLRNQIIEKAIREIILKFIREALTNDRIENDLDPYPQERIDKYIRENTDNIEAAVAESYDYYMDYYSGYGTNVGESSLALDMIWTTLDELLPDFQSRQTRDEAEPDDEYLEDLKEEEEEEEEELDADGVMDRLHLYIDKYVTYLLTDIRQDQGLRPIPKQEITKFLDDNATTIDDFAYELFDIFKDFGFEFLANLDIGHSPDIDDDVKALLIARTNFEDLANRVDEPRRETVAPSRGRETVAPSRGRETVAPSRGREVIAPSRGREVIAPSRGREVIAPVRGTSQRVVSPVREQVVPIRGRNIPTRARETISPVREQVAPIQGRVVSTRARETVSQVRREADSLEIVDRDLTISNQTLAEMREQLEECKRTEVALQREEDNNIALRERRLALTPREVSPPPRRRALPTQGRVLPARGTTTMRR
jgi:hypothetical protein